MNAEAAAKEVARLLVERNEKLVLAESCTAGNIAATLGRIDGISNNFCGSAVVYRPETKKEWLAVTDKTIDKHTCESLACAIKIATGVLESTPEATWALGIVGHIGAGAPKEVDGDIYVCIAKRKKNGKIKVRYTFEGSVKPISGRHARQGAATEIGLSALAQDLQRKSNTNKNGKKHG